MRAQCLRKPHRGCGLAFTKRGGGDGGYINIFSIRAILEAFQNFKFDLRFVGTVQLKFIFADAQFSGDLRNWFDVGSLGDVNIGGDRAYKLQLGRFEFHSGFRWRGFFDDFLNNLLAFEDRVTAFDLAFAFKGFFTGFALVAIESPY